MEIGQSRLIFRFYCGIKFFFLKSSNAEITNYNFLVIISHKDIFGFDISMDYILEMGCFNTIDYFVKYLKGGICYHLANQ